jgi:hypothetical protein
LLAVGRGRAGGRPGAGGGGGRPPPKAIYKGFDLLILITKRG